ncbi:uncharacterized protein A4U43_C01F25880 [Asparagus officinalis]|uniref:Uncharacterized protein n=1 Tax=Asparagus officinalis TaxID=4686 RepID=A0A5P1FS66_ASPOF|nr:uncharacterized protein A4U43_C01F25880 [Asparagus officinalis]
MGSGSTTAQAERSEKRKRLKKPVLKQRRLAEAPPSEAIEVQNELSHTMAGQEPPDSDTLILELTGMEPPTETKIGEFPMTLKRHGKKLALEELVKIEESAASEQELVSIEELILKLMLLASVSGLSLIASQAPSSQIGGAKGIIDWGVEVLPSSNEEDLRGKCFCTGMPTGL